MLSFNPEGWTYGLQPDVINHEGVRIAKICLIVMIGAAVLCFSRFFARSIIIRRWAVDDTVLVVAWICAAAYGAMAIAQTRYGLGLPPNARPTGQYLQTYTYINFVGRFVYTSGICLFKISFILALLRFIYNLPSLKSVLHIWRPWLWNAFWYITLSHIVQNLVLLLQCRPVSKSWHPATSGKCLDSTKTFYVMGANTIFCDFLTLAIAIPLILRMALTKTDRVTIAGLYSLGVFTAVCGGIRMWQIKQISINGDSSGLVEWGVVEINVGTALVAIPAATPIIDAIRGYTLSYPRGPSDPPHWSRPASVKVMYASFFWLLCRALFCKARARSVHAEFFTPRNHDVELNSSRRGRSFRRVHSPIQRGQPPRSTAAEHYNRQDSVRIRLLRSIESALNRSPDLRPVDAADFNTWRYTDTGSPNYHDSIPLRGPSRSTTPVSEPIHLMRATQPTVEDDVPQPTSAPRTPPGLISPLSAASSSSPLRYPHPDQTYDPALSRSPSSSRRKLLASSGMSPVDTDSPLTPTFSKFETFAPTIDEIFEPSGIPTPPRFPLTTVAREMGAIEGAAYRSPPKVYVPARSRSDSAPSTASPPVAPSPLRQVRSREDVLPQNTNGFARDRELMDLTPRSRGRQGRKVLSEVPEGDEDWV